MQGDGNSPQPRGLLPTPKQALMSPKWRARSPIGDDVGDIGANNRTCGAGDCRPRCVRRGSDLDPAKLIRLTIGRPQRFPSRNNLFNFKKEIYIWNFGYHRKCANLPGLPKTSAGVIYVAKRNAKPLERVSKVGEAIEYNANSLPVEAKAALLLRQGGGNKPGVF